MSTGARAFFTTADGCRLEYEVAGEGKPVLWQHGLGAPFGQPAGVFPETPGLQRITLACRGHEQSELGPLERISFASLADDALALLDHLGISSCAVGGISLGAGVALRLAAFHPARVTRLVLARPAWVDGPSLATQAPYLAVAEIIAAQGLAAGLPAIQRHPAYLALVEASPDNAKSILSYFMRPRPETTVALLSRLSASWPGVSRAAMQAITCPTLVIGNTQDLVHPLAFAEELAALILGARLSVITSKSVSPAAYEAEFKAALAQFLLEDA